MILPATNFLTSLHKLHESFGEGGNLSPSSFPEGSHSLESHAPSWPLWEEGRGAVAGR